MLTVLNDRLQTPQVNKYYVRLGTYKSVHVSSPTVLILSFSLSLSLG